MKQEVCNSGECFYLFFLFEYKLANGANVHSGDLCQRHCKWQRIELGFTEVSAALEKELYY